MVHIYSNGTLNNTQLCPLTLTTEYISSHVLKIHIHVPSAIIEPIRQQVINLYRHHLKPKGLEHSIIPLEFVEDHYEADIQSCTSRFILKQLVFDFIIEELTNQKIRIAHYPRFISADGLIDGTLSYTFHVSTNEPIPLKDWKLFPFKSPKRKLYKDLDKQVESFIEREYTLYKKQSPDILQDNDWVYFQATLLDHHMAPVAQEFQRNFWMKLSLKYLTSSFQKSFIDKKLGDTFIVSSLPVDETLPETISAISKFSITIKGLVKGSHFSIDIFKNTFKLKNKVDIHRKLIEVFSYRNDISQRKSIIEEVFHLFFSKHRFEVPKHLILRKQEEILVSLKKVPDYRVYKAQKNFIEQVAALAEKQLKEEMLIDQLSYEENIKVEPDDMSGYLHLFNNDRLKEFVYFKAYVDLVEESHLPIRETIIKNTSLREKTLNHVISTLTR